MLSKYVSMSGSQLIILEQHIIFLNIVVFVTSFTFNLLFQFFTQNIYFHNFSSMCKFVILFFPSKSFVISICSAPTKLGSFLQTLKTLTTVCMSLYVSCAHDCSADTLSQTSPVKVILRFFFCLSYNRNTLQHVASE